MTASAEYFATITTRPFVGVMSRTLPIGPHVWHNFVWDPVGDVRRLVARVTEESPFAIALRAECFQPLRI
jgi:hypothetical protein